MKMYCAATVHEDQTLFTTRHDQSRSADRDAIPHAAITPMIPPVETLSAGAAAFCVVVVDAPLPLLEAECDAPDPLALAEPLDADPVPDGDTEGAGDAKEKKRREIILHAMWVPCSMNSEGEAKHDSCPSRRMRVRNTPSVR